MERAHKDRLPPNADELRLHQENNVQGVAAYRKRAELSLGEAIVELEKVSGHIAPGRPGGAHSRLLSDTWFGTLTHQNIDAVAYKIALMLYDARYTWVSVNEALGYGSAVVRPEVRTGQRLKPEEASNRRAVQVYHKGDLVGFVPGSGDRHGASGFSVVDTYGVWGLSTMADDGAPEDNYKTPYIAFDYQKVTIEHRAPAGHRLCWVIALERERER